MRTLVGLTLGAVALALLSPVAGAQGTRTSSPAPGDRLVAGTRCSEFPADSWWRADVSRLRVHPRSRAWLSHMSPASDLHPDFGPSYRTGPDQGIPITVVKSSHRKVKVSFGYADESDKVGYPLGADTRIEGGRRSAGDRHAVVIDRDRCRLYETYDTRVRDGRWSAGSGAVWSLRSNRLRPEGWTSADAAGLPILPGLLRWNEVREDRIDHAIRFTTDVTSRHHLWPARHDAGSRDSLAYPPMGARFRLRAGWSPAGLSPYARRVVRALKTYGLVLADNGSPWFFQGEQHARWPTRLIEDLKTIPAAAFVAVDTTPLQVDDDSMAVR
ncbi:hypothetical protein [Nocardioides sp. cx-173]|uniref:hypothetical protein n=1 Tax=Nocardioides sp. cx-173 TaxID=2898796 RepID=UPI001E3B7BB6|nr:hypothetical protein [Nocardioides sp. cx-173]MCD4527408.1 hypothetical protein [Nocardioides sp. cx-173]UGB43858.1 hypothetical protein LQ940_10150 [Nocardioides sp. cx-173]